MVLLYKMLIITGIPNEKTNKLTTHEKLGRNVTIIYRQELASLFKLQEKLKTCRGLTLNFSSSCFIANDGHIRITWLHAVVFSEHDILRF